MICRNCLYRDRYRVCSKDRGDCSVFRAFPLIEPPKTGLSHDGYSVGKATPRIDNRHYRTGSWWFGERDWGDGLCALLSAEASG